MGYGLDEYLAFDRDSAVRQWRAILARSPAVPGRRQEPFRPIETVLCFALFRLVDPRRFGGRNLHQLPPAVPALAATLRRSPRSLLEKMQNLSFQRPHGARFEPEVFLRLCTEPDRFLALYTTIIEAARAVGLGTDSVPDFLGTAVSTSLLGQEEITDVEVGIAVHETRDSVGTVALRQWFGEHETERIVEQRVRLGQHRFATSVLAAFERRCGFCGFSPEGLGGRGLLIASHVKPWRDCVNDRERLDPRNGIAACPTHDRAFDGGLITVNGGMRIHRTRRLEARLADRVTESFFGPGTLRERLLVGEEWQPARVYLDYHREHVFDRAS